MSRLSPRPKRLSLDCKFSPPLPLHLLNFSPLRYNQQSHPLPFIKASQIVAPKRAPAKERPDLEEALEESEEEAIDAAEAKEDDEGELDLSKDKYVKAPKKKKAAAAAKKAAGKKKKAGDEEEDEEEDEEKPKKAKGKAKAKK